MNLKARFPLIRAVPFVFGVAVGALLVVPGFWLARGPSGSDTPESVVALVEGEGVLAEDVSHWMEDRPGVVLSPETALKEVAEQTALAVAAEKLGVMEDAEYRAAERALKIAFLRERTLQSAIADIEISDEEIRAAYEAQRDLRFRTPARFQVAALWLNHRGREPLKQAYVQRLEAVREAVWTDGVPAESGFGELALNATEHRGSRFQGGVLGWLGPMEYPDALRSQAVAVAPNLEPGAVSEVITNDQGVFLVRLMQTKPASFRPFTEVRSILESELRSARRAEVEERFKQEALAGVDLRFFPEHLPSPPSVRPDLLTRSSP